MSLRKLTRVGFVRLTSVILVKFVPASSAEHARTEANSRAEVAAVVDRRETTLRQSTILLFLWRLVPWYLYHTC